MTAPAPGELVGGQFELDAQVAAGGMGVVYRARDKKSGDVVAVKLLHARRPDLVERFELEARVLSRLSHANVVRYVGHGVTDGGAPYLAMEWLEGVTLQQRLRGAGLSPREALELCARVADALGAAHQLGIIHRDVKPANVMLLGGELERVKLVDFGVARLMVDSPELTATGAAIGTPAYMAPEQARGSGVDARADLFSLGCVLFECLAGRPAFAGLNLMAIMAKVLFEEAPPLAEARPGLPTAVGELVQQLLEKDRARRPPDASRVAAQLRGLALVQAGATPAPVRSPAAAFATSSESRLVSVVLARHPRVAALTPAELASTAPDADGRALAAIAGAAQRHGVRLEPLVDGSLAAVVGGDGAPVDLCARAGRFALAIAPLLPGAAVAMATGRAVLHGALPVGDVIERAAALLALPPAGVRIDEVTAGLVAAAFEVAHGEGGAGARLLRERELTEESRPLLGKATPCVGRDRELATLEASLAECVEDEVARAVVVIGHAGVGKSRLRQEFLRRARGRDVEVWTARGDPMRGGSSFALLADALMRAAGAGELDAPQVARASLRALVDAVVAAPERARVAEFLAAMCGVPPPLDEAGVEFRAAHDSPLLMADQLRRAFEDLVVARCARAPLLLVIEDLHFGDPGTVQLIDAALRRARELPLLVLALARPEVEQAFPGLWQERSPTLLRLGELSRKASEKLVRAVLGAAADDATVAKVVEVAAGNAFYLEELIRAVAEGRGDRLPGSLVAMAQSRIERLSELERLVLRAGAVFGDAFAPAGVAALVGDEAESGQVAVTLAGLVEKELLQKRESPRYPDEHAFRHALLREAAYGMLVDHDRARAHVAAGDWLERAGEHDARLLAEHFERGGDKKRAAGFYRRAAEQALEANDLEAVLERARRAAELGARGRDLAELRLLAATAHHWRTEYAQSERWATEAMRGLPPLSTQWFRAAEEVAEAALPLGRVERLSALAKALAPPPGGGAEARAAFVTTAGTVAMQLALGGQLDDSRALMTRLDGALAELGAPPPLAAARVAFARGTLAMMRGDVGEMLERARDAVAGYDAAGDLRNACLMRANLGYAHLELGAYAEAVETLRAAEVQAERAGVPFALALARQNLGIALARVERAGEALPVERAAVAAFAASKDQRLEGLSRVYLAQIHAALGERAEAMAEIDRAIAVLAAMAPTRAFALAIRASLELEAGEVAAALGSSEAAFAILGELGGVDEGEALVRLVRARALAAAGRGDEAARVGRDASERLRARAGNISESRWRERFLGSVPENRDTLASWGA